MDIWAPNKKQQRFATALEIAYKANNEISKIDVLNIAKEVKLSWGDLADLSNHEGYYRSRIPIMYLVRQIRNTSIMNAKGKMCYENL